MFICGFSQKSYEQPEILPFFTIFFGVINFYNTTADVISKFAICKKDVLFSYNFSIYEINIFFYFILFGEI